MKKSILILFIILSSFAFSQSKEYENCFEAKSIALKDFNNGLYFCKNIDYVEFVSLDKDFEHFFKNLIYSKYSIVIDHFNSKISEEDYCFSNTMDSLIYKKFGENIYKTTRAKAKEIYHSSEYEKSKLLDLSKTYSDVDSYPKFVGNDKIISDYAKDLFGNNKNSDINWINLTIGIDGKIEEFKVNFELPNKFDKTKIIKNLNHLGTFIPGYLLGIKVKSYTWFYF
jgi:hypothetical protein